MCEDRRILLGRYQCEQVGGILLMKGKCVKSSGSGSPETPTHADIVPVSAHRRRPFGLYAILVLLSVQTVLGVLLAAFLGVGMTVAPADIWAIMAPQSWSLLESLVTMLVTAVLVVGLWRYRLWAWYGMMLLLAYWMASDAVGYFRGTPEYISMALNVVMIFYMNQREVRVLFEGRSQADGAGA